jgi:hypothetical protein
MRLFWVICGLVECGAITEVEQLVKTFKPSDPRLLLGIFLGCHLVQHVRVSAKAERDVAKRTCDLLSGQIAHLKVKLLEEVKTELLEVRQGAINAIELT